MKSGNYLKGLVIITISEDKRNIHISGAGMPSNDPDYYDDEEEKASDFHQIMHDEFMPMTDGEFEELMKFLESKSEGIQIYQAGRDNVLISKYLDCRFCGNSIGINIVDEHPVPEYLDFGFIGKSYPKDVNISEFIMKHFKNSLEVNDPKQFIRNMYETQLQSLMAEIKHLKSAYGMEDID